MALVRCQPPDDLPAKHLFCCSGAVSYTHLDVYKRQEYDKTELYAFDLDTSEMELVDIEGVNSIMLGAEGTLLIQTNDALSSAVQYDVESGTLGEEILTVGEDERIAGVAWDAVDQRYVRFVQGQVITCDADGNEIVKAYIPVFDATENVPAACSATGLYALANGRYIFIRDITGDEAASQTILTVAGYLLSLIHI